MALTPSVPPKSNSSEGSTCSSICLAFVDDLVDLFGVALEPAFAVVAPLPLRDGVLSSSDEEDGFGDSLRVEEVDCRVFRLRAGVST